MKIFPIPVFLRSEISDVNLSYSFVPGVFNAGADFFSRGYL
jgi:hypothetical protein